VLKTRITEMLDIQYPIIQGGMAWLGLAELVAAVANAGGLGIIGSVTFPTPEDCGMRYAGQGSSPTNHSGQYHAAAGDEATAQRWICAGGCRRGDSGRGNNRRQARKVRRDS